MPIWQWCMGINTVRRKLRSQSEYPRECRQKGVWYSNVPGGVKKLVDEDKDYFKLIIKGFKDNTPTGTVNFLFVYT